MSHLPEQVAGAIRDRHLLRPRQGVLVAVSGGLDSMVLLHCLNQLARANAWKLTVAHFNHRLRGAESDGDEAFVAEAAKKVGLPCECASGDVRQRMQETGESLEMAARVLRHEFLGATARRLKIPSVALAHHADDQVELFFIRLLRGAGGEGLGGMKWLAPSPYNPQIILVRPLLGLRKADLELHARANQIAFREDTSNASHELLRNRVRHELLPTLTRNFDVAATTTILRSMDIVGAEAACVEEIARGWLAGKHGPAFAQLHVAVQRQCLHQQLLTLGISPEFDLVEQLRASPNHLISVDAGAGIFRTTEGLIQRRSAAKPFNVTTASIDLRAGKGQAKFGALAIEWQTRAEVGDHRPKAQKGVEYFDADKVGTVVKLRHWRQGDRFQPIGMAKAIKLQDFFTNLKIPRDRRREVVVATGRKGGIFWVEGLRIAESCKLTARTRRWLEWRWRGTGVARKIK